MRQFYIFITIILLASCGKPAQEQDEHVSLVTVVQDITDSLGIIPAADPILAIYDFENDKDKAAGFRLVLITDKKLNPVEEIHVEDGETSERENTNEEVDYREERIKSFYEDVRKIIRDFHTHYSPGNSLAHSECFATIAGELQLLAACKATQKMLIVYSDLQENTDVFSCYIRAGQSMLAQNPDKVAALLLKRYPLPDALAGITVGFVYNPLTREQDIMFGEMVAMYRKLLASRGAKIIVQASNKSYEL